MHIEIDYNGTTYKTKDQPSDPVAFDTAVKTMYDSFHSLNKAKFELEDGSTLIVGEGAFKHGAWRMVP